MRHCRVVLTYIGDRKHQTPTLECLWQCFNVMENPLKAGQALGSPDLIPIHSRWVTSKRVVVGSVHPVLTGLHAMADEVQHHRLTLHASIHGFLHHPEELGDVLAFLVAGRGTVPVGVMLGQMAGMLNELRQLILDVEPLAVPLRVQFLQFEDKVVLLAPWRT